MGNLDKCKVGAPWLVTSTVCKNFFKLQQAELYYMLCKPLLKKFPILCEYHVVFITS